MTTNAPLKPRTSLPLAVRVSVAVAIVVVLSLVWKTAERSSHEAVQTAQATFSRIYVTLPPVAVHAAARRQG